MTQHSLTEAIQHLRAGRLAEAEEVCRKLLVIKADDPEALHLLGVIASQTNRPVEALRLFDLAIAQNDHEASFHNSRGSLLYQLSEFAKAEAAFRQAIALAGKLADPYNNLGNTLRSLGRLPEAEASFRHALELRPGHADVHNNLGATLRDQGRLKEAEVEFRSALDLRPDDFEARYNLGDLLYDCMQLEEAETCFRQVLAEAPAFIPAYVGLAHVLQSMQRLDAAIDVLGEGLRRAPNHPMLTFAARLVYSSAIPGWHLPMVNDTERNDAYAEALQRAVTPDSVVLEIGTGSGLVAMMAARAGARHVYSCEVNRPLAQVAQQTVAINGLANRVTVIPKLSTQLEIGTDLPEKADVFVSELVNIGMLSPNMLGILQHARQHLVKPEARIIPARATVHGMLANCETLARLNPVRNIAGFDLSRFDIFRSPGYAQIDLASDPHESLSAPFEALDFDFEHSMPEQGRVDIPVVATASGLCHGVVFWFDLWMDETVRYSSASRSRTNHWKQAIHFFDEPVPLAPGDRVTIHAGYDNSRIFFVLTQDKAGHSKV